MSACCGSMSECCVRSSSSARRAGSCCPCHSARAATITFVSTATINSLPRDVADNLVHPLLPNLLDDLVDLLIRQLFFDRLDRHANGDTPSPLKTNLPRERLDLDMPVAARDLRGSARLESSLIEQLPRNGDRSAGINRRGHGQSFGRNHTSANNAIARSEHSNNSPCPTSTTISNRAFGIAAAIA